MEHKCPNCGSIIYSRRNVLCGVCGQRLPDELLFNSDQREIVERELKEAKRRAREAHTNPPDSSAPAAPGFISSTDFGSV